MEMTDAMAITKADGDNQLMAKEARASYANALHLFPPNPSGWIPQVLTCSALKKEGMKDIWEVIAQFKEQMQVKGWLQQNRARQQLNWMHDTIRQEVLQRFYKDPAVEKQLASVEQSVANGSMTAYVAAMRLLKSID